MNTQEVIDPSIEELLNNPQGDQVEEGPKGPFSSEGAMKMIASYYAIQESGDIADSLTNLLSIQHSYGYAMTLSNEVNHRQGKMRYVYDDTERELMKYSYEQDVDPNIDKRMEELFIYMINSYLQMHAEVNEDTMSVNEYKYHVNSVKTVLIMLFKNNQYGILPKLTIPVYAQKWVNDAIEMINNRQEDIYYEWISYLDESGNQQLVDKVKSAGQDFFKVNKAINTFYKYFQQNVDTIKNYDEVYRKFLEYRDEYIKVSTNITQKSLYPIFDTTDDTYNKRKKVVIEEFQQLFSGNSDENTKLLQQLIFGDGENE